MKLRYGLLALVVVLGGLQAARSQEIPHFPDHGWFDFKAPIMKDPVLQQSKETFIQYGCAYCHNVDLHPRGEAADLIHSPIVGSDRDGEMIMQVLRSGIPQTAKQSPMPQFSDLSEAEMKSIVRWIHYARMEGHFTELMASKTNPKGDLAAGKAFYAAECASCHAIAGVKRKVAGMNAEAQKAAVLKPALLERPISFIDSPGNSGENAGKTRHSRLLENYTDKEVADLLAYLQTPP